MTHLIQFFLIIIIIIIMLKILKRGEREKEREVIPPGLLPNTNKHKNNDSFLTPPVYRFGMFTFPFPLPQYATTGKLGSANLRNPGIFFSPGRTEEAPPFPGPPEENPFPTDGPNTEKRVISLHFLSGGRGMGEQLL